MQEFFAWPFVVVFMLPTCTVGPTLDLLYCMGPKAIYLSLYRSEVRAQG